MNELVQRQTLGLDNGEAEATRRAAQASRQVSDAMFGLQRLLMEEFAFVASEFLERAQTESHLVAEFMSKFASSHSVRDWESLVRECGQHQLDFIRRDCDRVLRHSERFFTASVGLFEPISHG
jgi:hypothetical protein